MAESRCSAARVLQWGFVGTFFADFWFCVWSLHANYTYGGGGSDVKVNTMPNSAQTWNTVSLVFFALCQVQRTVYAAYFLRKSREPMQVFLVSMLRKHLGKTFILLGAVFFAVLYFMISRYDTCGCGPGSDDAKCLDLYTQLSPFVESCPMVPVLGLLVGLGMLATAVVLVHYARDASLSRVVVPIFIIYNIVAWGVWEATECAQADRIVLGVDSKGQWAVAAYVFLISVIDLTFIYISEIVPPSAPADHDRSRRLLDAERGEGGDARSRSASGAGGGGGGARGGGAGDGHGADGDGSGAAKPDEPTVILTPPHFSLMPYSQPAKAGVALGMGAGGAFDFPEGVKPFKLGYDHSPSSMVGGTMVIPTATVVPTTTVAVAAVPLASSPSSASAYFSATHAGAGPGPVVVLSPLLSTATATFTSTSASASATSYLAASATPSSPLEPSSPTSPTASSPLLAHVVREEHELLHAHAHAHAHASHAQTHTPQQRRASTHRVNLDDADEQEPSARYVSPPIPIQTAYVPSSRHPHHHQQQQQRSLASANDDSPSSPPTPILRLPSDADRDLSSPTPTSSSSTSKRSSGKRTTDTSSARLSRKESDIFPPASPPRPSIEDELLAAATATAARNHSNGGSQRSSVSVLSSISQVDDDSQLGGMAVPRRNSLSTSSASAGSAVEPDDASLRPAEPALVSQSLSRSLRSRPTLLDENDGDSPRDDTNKTTGFAGLFSKEDNKYQKLSMSD